MNKKPNDESARTDITIGSPAELIVLACNSNALRCRVPGTTRELTLRTAVRDEVPGDIVTLVPTREWTHRRHAHRAGAVSSIRHDVEALGLTPLALREAGEWDPAEEYWGEADEPLDEWAEAIVAYGTRPSFEPVAAREDARGRRRLPQAAVAESERQPGRPLQPRRRRGR